MAISSKLLTLYIANGCDAHFEVDEETADSGKAKSLFATDASNPESDMLYALFENNNGEFERPLPMAEGKSIPAEVLAIVDDDGKQLEDSLLLKEVGWKLQVIVKPLLKCFPGLEGVQLVKGDESLSYDTSLIGKFNDEDEVMDIADLNTEQLVLRLLFVQTDNMGIYHHVFNLLFKNTDHKVGVVGRSCLLSTVGETPRHHVQPICMFFMTAESLVTLFEEHLKESFLNNSQASDQIFNVLKKSRNFLPHAARLRIAKTMETKLCKAISAETFTSRHQYSTFQHSEVNYHHLRIYRDLITELEKIDELYSNDKVVARLRQFRIYSLGFGIEIEPGVIGSSGKSIHCSGFWKCNAPSTDDRERETGPIDHAREEIQKAIVYEKKNCELFSDMFKKDFPSISIQQDGPPSPRGETFSFQQDGLFSIFKIRCKATVLLSVNDLNVLSNENDLNDDSNDGESSKEAAEKDHSDCESEFVFGWGEERGEKSDSDNELEGKSDAGDAKRQKIEDQLDALKISDQD